MSGGFWELYQPIDRGGGRFGVQEEQTGGVEKRERGDEL